MFTAQNAYDLRRDLGRVVRVYEQAKLSVAERVAGPVLIPRQYSLPAGERFEINNPEAFGPAGHREDVAEVVMFGKLFVRNEAGENHRVLYAGLGDQLFDPWTVRALTNQ